MTDALLSALGGLGLFLFGMHLLTGGLRAIAGPSLRRCLARWTRSPLSGAVTGALSTTAVQSSSATTVAAVGFVGAGILTFPQALGVIFGANVGSTVTGWLVALLGFRLEIGRAALPLVLLAALIALFGGQRASRAGPALGGFCLVFLGIAFLQEGMAGLAGRITPADLPSDTLGGRLLLVGIGAAITVITQSSAAGVAMAMSALIAGSISFAQATALVIGMDVGTTGTALIATIGASISARRTGIAHVVFNLFTAVGALILVDPFVGALERWGGGFLERDPEIGLVAFHSTFNLIGTLLVLPVAGPFARLIVRIVRTEGSAIADPLDPHLLRAPELAVPAAAESMRRACRRGFAALATALGHGEGTHLAGELDEIEAGILEIRSYLDRLPAGPRAEGIERPYATVAHLIDHLERLTSRLRRRHDLSSRRIGLDLAERARRLGSVAAELAAGPDAPPAIDGTIHVLWEELEREIEEVRKDALRRSVAGELSLDAADARLDAHRWLRRTAFHVWRLRLHLGELGRPETGR